MKKFVIILISIITIIQISTVFANCNCNTQNNKQWNRHRGFYGEIGAGSNLFYALLPSNNEGTFAGGSAGLSVGYNIINNVALEGGFIYSSELNYAVEKRIEGIDVSASTAARLYIPYLAFRFIVPVGNRFSVIFKLGGMYPFGSVDIAVSASSISTSGRISDDGLLIFSAIGATFAVTPHLDINLMYQGAIYVLASGGVLTAGLTYHFK